MGFFDKLFGGKTEQEETVKFFGQSKTVLTPIRGKVLAQADIPDETFAQGILGPGCGIEPTGKTVYAPFDGTVEQVASALREDTVLVSMMLVNNETGCVFPVEETARLLREKKSRALLHCDAVQGFLKVP